MFSGPISPGKMTSLVKVLAEVTKLQIGEKGNVYSLRFRDPNSLKAG